MNLVNAKKENGIWLFNDKPFPKIVDIAAFLNLPFCSIEFIDDHYYKMGKLNTTINNLEKTHIIFEMQNVFVKSKPHKIIENVFKRKQI